MKHYRGPWWANGHDDAKLRRMHRERTIPPMARRHRWWVLRRIHWPRVLYTGTRLMVGRNGRAWPNNQRFKSTLSGCTTTNDRSADTK